MKLTLYGYTNEYWSEVFEFAPISQKRSVDKLDILRIPFITTEQNKKGSKTRVKITIEDEV